MELVGDTVLECVNRVQLHVLFPGQTYEQILNHYFPETEIKSVY